MIECVKTHWLVCGFTALHVHCMFNNICLAVGVPMQTLPSTAMLGFDSHHGITSVSFSISGTAGVLHI